MKSIFWKVLFHKDSFILIAALVYLWFSISLILDSTYDFSKLTPHAGHITEVKTVITKIINKPLFKDTTRQLRLSINTESQYFTHYLDKNNKDNIIGNVAIGDSVTLYTKRKIWGIFGFGNNRAINHLVKSPNQVTLVDFNEVKGKSSSVISLMVVAFIIFIIWYIKLVRHRLWWELGGCERDAKRRTTVCL